MHAQNVKARIMSLVEKSKFRRRLGVRELIRMPCLLPATIIVLLGLLAVAVGAGMSVVGYIPNHTSQNTTNAIHGNEAHMSLDPEAKDLTRKMCAYVGPILMALGIFAIITACVFYCEVLDKYTILVPGKRVGVFSKEELYKIIVDEMKKSYAQTLITIYSKAAEQSLLMDNQSCSGEYIPENIFPYKAMEPLTLEQQIDIECEGYTPSPPIPNKRYSVIQARIQRLKSEDNWLKTSSLPNIRRIPSIKRAGRVSVKMSDSRTLSCDYTMDEARLRRKSMMLRTLVQWNSGSSDLFAQRQRRFSSVKALPSYNRESIDDASEDGYGSFPLTRLIQRRGTFACGDMRTRRMKFMLLLEASESQEGFNDTTTNDGRHTVAGIRRNSFIPYTTCDKFIAVEEKKTIRDRRRSSVNPFSLRNRVGPQVPENVVRRHSFYPIRKESKIYHGDPNELRRHSFNPIGVNNILRPEFAARMEGRRASFNPETLQGRTGERRLSHVPLQSGRFLQVPGLDPQMEGRPSTISEDGTDLPQHSASDPGFGYRTGASQLQPPDFQDDRRIDRRHSYNPLLRLSSGKVDGGQLKVPKITFNEDSPKGFLSVPSQDYCIEERERRHSFNTSPVRTTLTAASSKFNEKPSHQRISFNLEPSAPSTHLTPSSTQTATKSTLKAPKPSSDPVRPSSFKQEMVVFKPLRQPLPRSTSPSSNISCCGSEKTGNEHLGAISRTVSACSDRSMKSAFRVSPLAADSIWSYGPLQQYTSAGRNVCETSMVEDSRLDIIQTEPLSPNFIHMDNPLSTAGSLYNPETEHKSAFRFNRRKSKTRYQHLDTPGSSSSGPASLSTVAKLDTSAPIHRSKSASALHGAGTPRPFSPLTTFSYARVPKPKSPLVARHKMQARHGDNKYS